MAGQASDGSRSNIVRMKSSNPIPIGGSVSTWHDVGQHLSPYLVSDSVLYKSKRYCSPATFVGLPIFGYNSLDRT